MRKREDEGHGKRGKARRTGGVGDRAGGGLRLQTGRRAGSGRAAWAGAAAQWGEAGRLQAPGGGALWVIGMRPPLGGHPWASGLPAASDELHRLDFKTMLLAPHPPARPVCEYSDQWDGIAADGAGRRLLLVRGGPREMVCVDVSERDQSHGSRILSDPMPCPQMVSVAADGLLAAVPDCKLDCVVLVNMGTRTRAATWGPPE